MFFASVEPKYEAKLNSFIFFIASLKERVLLISGKYGLWDCLHDSIIFISHLELSPFFSGIETALSVIIDVMLQIPTSELC